MKKLLMGAAALAAMSATTPAFAQATNEVPQMANYAVTGFINASCGNATGTPLQFGQLQIDPTGRLIPPPLTQSVNNTYCNGVNSSLSVASTPMTTAATPPSASFTNTLDYDAVVSFGPANLTVNSNPGTQQTATVGAFVGPLTVQATNVTTRGNTLPLAGDYSGTITVTLTPGV